MTAARAGVVVVGSINLDVRWAVDRLPVAGETVLSSGSSRGLGGKGANQAAAVSALGIPCSLVAAVGDDETGGWLLSRLAERGVDTAAVLRLGAPSGQAQVVVEAAGDNLIVVSPGANGALTAAHVEQALAGSSATALVAQQEIGPEAVAAALRWAGRQSRIAVLNAAPARQLDLGLLAGTGVLVVNRGEAAELSGRGDPGEAARALLAQGAGAVLVSLGGDGALLDDGSGAVSVPAPAPAQVVDTTGAGDVLTGVVAAGLARGLALAAAVEIGVRAASWSVGRPGVRAPAAADIGLVW